MGRFIEMFNTLAASRKARWVGAPLVLAAAAATVISVSQTAPIGGTAPLVNLAAEPLYAAGDRVKPTLTLALSVEFPTVGAQYVRGPGDTLDDTYSPNTEYPGYFDPEGCYLYNGNPRDVPADTPVEDYRRFDYVSDADRRPAVAPEPRGASLRTCGGRGFSGNFMNWATSSAIDILRYGLTGGDRVVDTEQLTVLQRAYLPTTERNNFEQFWNGQNFPAKRLAANLVAGALPTGFVGNHGGAVFVANCRNRVHFGTRRDGDCEDPGDNSEFGVPGSAQPLTPDNFFYARVSVCGTDATNGNLTDSRTRLCQRYPSGNFKPVGNLQRSSDVLRVAAFGYLMDNRDSNQRQGGVLRAPMKYVGERSYDRNFNLVPGDNPHREWNPATGVFRPNPHEATEGLSGVTSYLNRFGRTGAQPGVYKRYDPVGELYYESLRYIQGLPPTPEAIQGLPNATLQAGFPAYTSWEDPHPPVDGLRRDTGDDYTCIKNNILAIGDVNANQDRFIPGNRRPSNEDPERTRGGNLANNEPDFYEFTRVVGAFEANQADVTYFDGQGQEREVGAANPNPIASLWQMETGSVQSAVTPAYYYIAGVAYWANTHDIRGTNWTADPGPDRRRPGMRVKTFMIDVNEFGRQTDLNNRRRNQFFLAAKYGGFDDRDGTGNPFTNQNWQRGNTGEPRNYYLSSSAQGVLDALDEVFDVSAEQARSIAGGAISTQKVTTNTGYLYQAEFDPNGWSGDLIPVAIAASGTNARLGAIAASPWRTASGTPSGAAGVLDSRNLDTAPRNIYVGFNQSASTPSFGSSAFTWGTVPPSVQAALANPGNPVALNQPDANGELRLNYLRGDRSSEAPTGPLRPRTSRLGDIVNSGVAYSGAPSAILTQTDAYITFRNTYANRAKALFVGANDGMLHAFNADTGAEMFAYIPSWFVPRLSALTHPSYRHQSYQDATAGVGEANLGTTEDEDWRTVLVSGSGAGGQGVFALDVTNPAAFNNDNVLWEFTDRDDPALGNVIGRPQILKLNIGTAAQPNYRWFAVVASGVNNNANDGSASNGAPALFFLRLDKPKTGRWIEGTNEDSHYFKVVFPQNATDVANGMVGFTVRLGDGGEVNFVYAGDLQGNLWKLDLSAYDNSAPASVNAFSFFRNAANAAIPMYTARDANGRRQPITMEPALVFGPNRGFFVSFGTGKYLESVDNMGPFSAQSVYTLLDNNARTPDADPNTATAAIAGRGRLRPATTVSGTAVDVSPFVWGRATTDVDTGQAATNVRSGWYFDFADSANSGERQLSNFAVISGRLIFGSVIPGGNACTGGTGNLYVVNVRTGDGSVTASTVGILGEPLVVQIGASTVTGSDSTGQRREETRYQIILQGSGGTAAPPDLDFPDITWPGRLSWREISNFRDIQATP